MTEREKFVIRRLINNKSTSIVNFDLLSFIFIFSLMLLSTYTLIVHEQLYYGIFASIVTLFFVYDEYENIKTKKHIYKLLFTSLPKEKNTFNKIEQLFNIVENETNKSTNLNSFVEKIKKQIK